MASIGVVVANNAEPAMLPKGPTRFMVVAQRYGVLAFGASLMAVYVDNMLAGYGRMKMCHMIADSTEELLAMADAIRVARKWIQKAGTYQEHFDICLSKRAKAVELGAKQITMKQLARISLTKASRLVAIRESYLPEPPAPPKRKRK